MSTPSPEFTFPSARKVFADLAPKPTPEPPRIAAARQLLERTPAASRDYVGAEIIRRADGPDEAMALHTLVTEQLAADAAQADEDLARTITEALPAAEPAPDEHRPYVGDDGRLRTSDGRVLDDPERAAETLRTLATVDHAAANSLLDRLEDADPAMATQVVAELGGEGEEG